MATAVSKIFSFGNNTHCPLKGMSFNCMFFVFKQM